MMLDERKKLHSTDAGAHATALQVREERDLEQDR